VICRLRWFDEAPDNEKFRALKHRCAGAFVARLFDVQCIKPASSDILTLTDGRCVTLLETLGRGRYGVVQRATVESGWGIRRPAVVKRFQLGPDADPGDTMRSLGEIARRLVYVRHPNVIQLLELDRTDRLHAYPHTPFVVSELVEGEALQSILGGWQRTGTRPPMDFALVVTLRAAEALGAALFTESADGSLTGLLHGDLSPRQILISNQGEVKVADFGQFTLGDGQSGVRGHPTLEFTAPEVVWGNAPDARSDVFSLGAILRELLIGPRFMPGRTSRDAMRMIRDGHFDASLLEPNIPRSLRDVMEGALAPNPKNRYAHARALAFDLRREMMRLGLSDAQTCIRHAIVGWCETETPPVTLRTPPPPAANDVLNALLDTVDPIGCADTDEVESLLDEADLIEEETTRLNSEVVPKGELEEDDLPEFLFGSQPPSVTIK
jgi:serine/threonine-protein kinase